MSVLDDPVMSYADGCMDALCWAHMIVRLHGKGEAMGVFRDALVLCGRRKAENFQKMIEGCAEKDKKGLEAGRGLLPTIKL